MRRIAITLVMLCSLLVTSVELHAEDLDALLSGFEEDAAETAASEQEDALEGLMQGFDEETERKKEEADEPPPLLPDWLVLKGGLSLLSTINFAHDAPEHGQPDYRGLSEFRGHGELIGDFTFGNWKMRVAGTAFYDAAYTFNDQRDLYTDDYLDEYEDEVELGEFYLHGPLTENLDLKVGRQIVVWGKSDNIRITDILNPLDLRYPGMLDIRYLRLPVTMTKLDYFVGDWSISTMMIHEPRFDKYTLYNGEFYPANQPAPVANEPGWSWDNQQYALSANGIFSGWDLSFYAASVFQEQAYLDSSTSGTPSRKWERTTMFGSAVNIALGNWLLKGEVAFWNSLRYSTTTDEKSRFDFLAGVEYSGFNETTISFELADRHILDYDLILENAPDYQKEDWLQYVLRFVRNFRNDTVHFTVLLSSFGLFSEDGGFERIQLEYDLSDSISVMGGVVFYEGGDHPGFRTVEDNDRLIFELKYRF